MRLRDVWRPLPWWIKALLVLDGLTGIGVLIRTAPWSHVLLLWGATLIALDFWANRGPRRSRLEDPQARDVDGGGGTMPNYRQLHEESLAQNRPDLHRELKQSGKLQEHLDAVQRDAQSLYDRVLADLKLKHPFNPVEWKNSREAWEGALERSAREFVLSDRVLVPDEETEKAERNGYTD